MVKKSLRSLSLAETEYIFFLMGTLIASLEILDQISHDEDDTFFLHLSGACPNLIGSYLFFVNLSVQCTYRDFVCWGSPQDLKIFQADPLSLLSTMENTCTYFYPDRLWKWNKKTNPNTTLTFLCSEKPISSYFLGLPDRNQMPFQLAGLAARNTYQVQVVCRSPFYYN